MRSQMANQRLWFYPAALPGEHGQRQKQTVFHLSLGCENRFYHSATLANYSIVAIFGI